MELFALFRDGYKILPKLDTPVPVVEEAGLSNDYYNKIAKETGDRYKVPKEEQQSSEEEQSSPPSNSRHWKVAEEKSGSCCGSSLSIGLICFCVLNSW